MEALRILEEPGFLTWEYDADADVLYIAVGEPRPAVTVDLGDGLFARYDEQARELVGLTVLGLKDRLLTGLVERRSV